MAKREEENVETCSAQLRQHQSLSLASDVTLLKCMQSLSQKIVSRTSDLIGDLDLLAKETTTASIQVENCIQNLNLTSTKQFVEKRVYDEEVKDHKKEESSATVPVFSPNDLVPKIREAISLGLPPIQSQFDCMVSNGDVTNYLIRPLPYILGSEEFIDSPHVGIVKREQQKMTRAPTLEPIEDLAPTLAESVPVPDVSAQSSIESSPRTSSRVIEEIVSDSEVSSLSSKGARPVSVSEPAKQRAFGTVQDELAARLKIPFVPSTTDQNPEDGPPLKAPQPAPRTLIHPPSKRNLFDDSSSDESSDDLFKPISAKATVPPPNIFIPTVSKPQDPSITVAKVNGTATAIKPKKSTLFGSSDSEDDLFGDKTTPIISKAPSVKPATLIDDKDEDIFTPKSRPAVSSALNENGKTVPSSLPAKVTPPIVSAPVAERKLVTPISKPGTLFADSDSEGDDLFSALVVKPKVPTVQSTNDKVSSSSPQSNVLATHSSRYQSTPVKDIIGNDTVPEQNLTPASTGAIPKNPQTAAVQQEPSQTKKSSSLFFNMDDSDDEDLFAGVASRIPSKSPAAAPAVAPAVLVEHKNTQEQEQRVAPHVKAVALPAEIPKPQEEKQVPSSVTPPLLKERSQPPPVASDESLKIKSEPNGPSKSTEAEITTERTTNLAPKQTGALLISADIRPPDRDGLVISSNGQENQRSVENNATQNTATVVSTNNSNPPSDAKQDSNGTKKTALLLFADDSDDEDLFGTMTAPRAPPKPLTSAGSKKPVLPFKVAIPVTKLTASVSPTRVPESNNDSGPIPEAKSSPCSSDTPISEEKEPTKAEVLPTTSRIASLKLSLAMQPNSLHFSPPGSAVTSPSDGASPSNSNMIRKPFGGISLFGPPAPAKTQPDPVPQDPRVDTEGQNTDSLLCMGRERPKAPSRRLPSRGFRHSQILENDTMDAVLSGSVTENLKTPDESIPPPASVIEVVEESKPAEPKPAEPKPAEPKPAANRAVKPLFDDSDSSDGELFKPNVKLPEKVEPQTDSSVPSQSSSGLISNVKINSSLLADLDSDDGLFSSQAAIPTPRKLAPSLLVDSDDDDLFASVPKHRSPSKTAPSAKASSGSKVPLVDDPLLGFRE